MTQIKEDIRKLNMHLYEQGDTKGLELLTILLGDLNDSLKNIIVEK